MTHDHASCFARLAGLPEGARPHDWQSALAQPTDCANRLIRIPTGMGKTFGVLCAWVWHRLVRGDESWPRRLVWCLPMRVLVEQVVAEISAALTRAGFDQRVRVHVLMGGVESAEWHLAPEREAVLVGTQDMLLSRALNRGYAAPRARWPMDFGLLNQDALWVMDEVQLMDVGLATSGQLQAFREQDAALASPRRPCKTWWMSATLQLAWLHASPDTQPVLGDLPQVRVAPAQQRGALWDGVHKPVRIEPVGDTKKLAALVVEAHLAAGRGASGPTLVVVNRVETANEVHDALAANKALKGVTDLRLVHSRFRPADRAGWREAFLNRAGCASGTDRIVVATQVVEAGVDISAAVLVTELAPWPSLVQRFGRSARWGGTAQVIVADAQPKDDKAAAPYTASTLDAARTALALLNDVSPRELEAFEDAHPELLSGLYPYTPRHLLMRNEIDELFDTSADLSGADIDISRFIRSGEERDLQVFWHPVEPGAWPASALRAHRDELCSVPFLRAQEWLCDKQTGRLKPHVRAWVWDWVEGEWVRTERRQLYPGQTVLVATEIGGYLPERGWSPKSTAPVPVVAPRASDIVEAAAAADSAENDESLSEAAGWQTIAFHGQQVARQATALADALAPALSPLLGLAGRWHDVGKAHPAFQGSLLPHRFGADMAKAPKAAWQPPRRLYLMPDGSQRRGLRHELASTLALFALLRRCHLDHLALLGPWRELLSQLPGGDRMPPSAPPPADLTPLEQEVLALDADSFDLLLYLVCAHHGKVRMSWHASPADQAAQDEVLRIRGLRTGDVLPPVTLADAEGGWQQLPVAELVLAPAAAGLNPHTGRGWTERVLGLLQRHGPFALAWMEALLRAADQRATREALQNDDPLILSRKLPSDGLETSDRTLARAVGGGEAPPSLDGHSAQRGAQLRAGGRTGGSGDAGSRTRPPAHATRYLQTRLGTLSYAELAPHLAMAAQRVESDIAAGSFDGQPLDDALIAELHRRLCSELTPQFVGWRRDAVQVGTHLPPDPHQVPMLMREYALDLQARLEAVQAQAHPQDGLLEALAFAEGRLLSIHPFTDFNGRTTRLFLRLLLRRLDLPDVDLAPGPQHAQSYFEALRAGDHRDWRALMQVWRQRFENITIGGRE